MMKMTFKTIAKIAGGIALVGMLLTLIGIGMGASFDDTGIRMMRHHVYDIEDIGDDLEDELEDRVEFFLERRHRRGTLEKH